MNPKIIGAAVLALAVGLALTSCSSGQAHRTSAAKPGMNCGAYARLSVHARETAAKNTSIQSVVAFESKSAVSLDARGALDKACADASAGALIDDVATDVEQTYPSCADYLALSADVQEAWADAYFTLLAYPMTPRIDQRSPALVVGCKAADSASTIDTAGKDVEIYLHNRGAAQGENDMTAYLQGDTVTIAAQAVINDSWTDGQGYSYSLKLQATTPTITVDTANALPGKVDVSAAFTMKGTLTNTTAARNAPMPTYLIAEPVWASAAPACTGSYKSEPFASNTPGMSTTFCGISGQPGPVTPVAGGTKIAAGSTVDVQVQVSNKVIYPQASQSQVAASLSSPKLWALARNEGQGLLYGCLMLSGAYYVSASSAPTGCPAASS